MLIVCSLILIFVVFLLFRSSVSKERFFSSTTTCNSILAQPFSSVDSNTGSTTSSTATAIVGSIYANLKKYYTAVDVESTTSHDYAAFKEVNKWRAEKSLPPYAYSPQLSAVAQLHAKYFFPPSACPPNAYHSWGCPPSPEYGIKHGVSYLNIPGGVPCPAEVAPCCYDGSNPSTFSCMGNKVSQITGDPHASGGECFAVGHSSTPNSIVREWTDPAHYNVVMSKSVTRCGCGFSYFAGIGFVSCWFN